MEWIHWLYIIVAIDEHSWEVRPCFQPLSIDNRLGPLCWKDTDVLRVAECKKGQELVWSGHELAAGERNCTYVC